MKKAVITGATSFIGRKLAMAMVAYGWDVCAVVRGARTLTQEMRHITTLHMEMEQYHNIGKAIGGCDCFVHLAWSGTRGAARMDRELQQANRQHSIAAVRSMLEAGCNHVVSAGSQAEYGPQSGLISEETSCMPNTAYGAEKLQFYHEMAELCQQMHVSYREPRFFSLYGPGDFDGTMVMSTLSAMLRSEPCQLTEGIQMWDFMFIEDAADALLRLCEGAGENGIYNLGSGDARHLKDYILEMKSVTASKSELCFGTIPYPPIGMVSICPDISKLKEHLAWEAKVSFADGIRKIVESMNARI